MNRRTTGPIRRAKGGWTAEEVSIWLLETVVSSSPLSVFWLDVFFLLAKLIEIGIQLIKFNSCESIVQDMMWLSLKITTTCKLVIALIILSNLM